MKINQLFENHSRIITEKKIQSLLNSGFDFSKINTPWCVGDYLSSNARKLFGLPIKNYSSDFARRAMADLAFSDKEGFYYIVDVKTHRLETHFNMPNLTSVERLARFYEDDKNYFIVMLIAYHLADAHIKVKKVHFVPIEFLSWECLTIGALGWGQIQIANSNKIIITPQARKKWMLELCDTVFEFYPAEISKIKERVIYFKKVQARWQAKKD